MKEGTIVQDLEKGRVLVAIMETGKWAVETVDLRKHYLVPVRKQGFMRGAKQLLSQDKREIRAVDGITFRIGQGEFVGYVGPNGAGKSTTIKMLAGILHPTSGRISVNGLSPQVHRQTLATQIGVVFGQRTQLWWDLPVIDSFDILAAMYCIGRKDYKRFLDEFAELLGLNEFLDIPVRRLSLGQRMRADLAGSLIHNPKVLFLDEPTIGLDVVAKGKARDFLSTMSREKGCTILLTTHDLQEIEELCSRVMVINHGRLIYDGSITALRDKVNLPAVMKVKFSRLPAAIDQCCDGSGQEGLAARNSGKAWWITAIDGSSNTVEIRLDRLRSTVPAVIWALQESGEIRDVFVSDPPIEQVIRILLEQEPPAL